MLSILFCILQIIFSPPVDYDISLAGNFGEPRPNHFHGGLDVKTENVEGKHIYSIGDGYVSRVTVGLYGFGNAVYVTHPTGHTSVYCHLKAFSPRIRKALRKYQYSHETSVGDAYFSPIDVPVSQGQFIALSGNSGHSTGPHLHLEVHDTRSWDMVDPYELLADNINDSVPPQAHSFMAIPQEGGSFNGSGNKQNFGFSSHHLEREFTAWGRVGFALWSDDYMQGTYNHYGVRYTTLLVDGVEVFSSDVGRIPVCLNRMVNVWGDYEHYLRSHVWYMKSFIEPGCRLSFLKADKNRGIVDFCEERPYRIEYVLRDYNGNTSTYSFVVNASPNNHGVTQNKNLLSKFRYDRTNSYSYPGIQLVVPYGLLGTDITLSPIIRQQPDGYSPVCVFASASQPILSEAELNMFSQHSVDDTSKLYITNDQKRYFGGDYHDGWVSGRIKELSGAYRLAYDDQPPIVRPVSVGGDRLVLSVTDSGSGIASWTATVDGRFIVFDAIEKSSSFVCLFKESWLRPTKSSHTLEFSATDNRKNTQVYKTTFTY